MPVRGIDRADPAQVRGADVDHAIAHHRRGLDPGAPEVQAPLQRAGGGVERVQARAAIADQHATLVQHRRGIDLGAGVEAPRLLAAGALQRVDEVVGAAEHDALAGERRAVADAAARIEAPAPLAARRIDGVEAAVARAHVHGVAGDQRLRALPVPVEHGGMRQHAWRRGVAERVAPLQLAAGAIELVEVSVVGDDVQRVGGQRDRAVDRRADAVGPGSAAVARLDRIDHAAGGADVGHAVGHHRRGIGLAAEARLPTRRRSRRHLGRRLLPRQRLHAPQLGGTVGSRQGAHQAITLERKRQGEGFVLDLVAVATQFAAGVDIEVVHDRLGQAQRELALVVAPELEAYLDPLLGRAHGAEPLALDRVRGGGQRVAARGQRRDQQPAPSARCALPGAGARDVRVGNRRGELRSNVHGVLLVPAAMRRAPVSAAQPSPVTAA